MSYLTFSSGSSLQKQTVEQFETSIITFAVKFTAILMLTAAMFMWASMANAAPMPIDCPNGSHWVTPPCYWDANGYQQCPPAYEVCN